MSRIASALAFSATRCAGPRPATISQKTQCALRLAIVLRFLRPEVAGDVAVDVLELLVAVGDDRRNEVVPVDGDGRQEDARDVDLSVADAAGRFAVRLLPRELHRDLGGLVSEEPDRLVDGH